LEGGWSWAIPLTCRGSSQTFGSKADLSGEGFEGVDDLSSSSPPPFISCFDIEWVFPMIGHYQSGHVDLVSWLPCVIAIWIPFPLDEVLKALFTAIKAVINDGLNLIFFGIFDQLWGWPRVVDPVLCCFTIGGQKGCMKDVMDGPGWGQGKLICNR
jgi:hypothetical protein